MEECPRCKSTNFRKDGIVKEKQRYLCKDCHYHFTVKQRGKSDDVKKNALHLYLEGLGFRSIGRYLGVSHVAVFNWIKAFGEKLESLRSSTKIEVVELDEMHTYIQSKKTIAGSGLLSIEMGKSSSTAKWVVEEPRPEKSSGNA
jgi:transposase